MRAVQITAWGGPEVLEVKDIPEPSPVAGQVRVKVAATTVNPADVWTAAGGFSDRFPHLQPPFTPGWDFAGTVLEDSNGFTAGQHVIGLIPFFDTGSGATQEIVSVDPSWIAPLPDGVSFVDAGSVALNATTAWQALDNLALTAGESIVVTGASGAVGSFGVQEAVARGVTVIAIASKGDADFVRSLGANSVIERSENTDLVAEVRSIVPDGVDAVFDGAGATKQLIAAVKDGGKFNSINGGQLPESERNVDVSFTGVVPNAQQLERAGELLTENKLVTRVAEEISLEDVSDAYARVGKGDVRGKLVVKL